MVKCRRKIVLCVNCCIAGSGELKTEHEVRATDLHPDLQSILEQWIEREVTHADNVCRKCCQLLNKCTGDDYTRKFPSRKYCSGCGTVITTLSTLRKDSPNGMIVQSWHPNQKLEDPVPVCRACSSTTYAMMKGRYISISREYDEVDEDSVSNEYVRNMIKQSRPGAIYLPNYRVSSASSHECLYKGCKNSSRKRVPPLVREMVLTNYKIFVSSHSRICDYHLNLCDWDELTGQENLKRLFRTHEIEDAFALMTKERVYGLVNFDDIENIPVNICRYFTGLSITDFLELHDSIQWNIDASKQALATLLIKLKTGDSFERIAVLLGLSETYVKKLFYIACKCLEKSDCTTGEQITTDGAYNESDSESCSSDDVPLSNRINIQANNMLQENHDEGNNVNRRSSSDNKRKNTNCNDLGRHRKKNQTHSTQHEGNFVDSGDDNFRADDKKQLNENIDINEKNASNKKNSREMESINNHNKSINNRAARETGVKQHKIKNINNDENRDSNTKKSNCNIDHRSKQESDERREDSKCENDFEVEYLDEMFL